MSLARLVDSQDLTRYQHDPTIDNFPKDKSSALADQASEGGINNMDSSMDENSDEIEKRRVVIYDEDSEKDNQKSRDSLPDEIDNDSDGKPVNDELASLLSMINDLSQAERGSNDDDADEFLEKNVRVKRIILI